jgi:release factor glutamine methyltransferase
MTALTCEQALQMARTLGLDRLDAQLLLLHALGRPDSDRAWLLAHDGDTLAEPSASAFQQVVLRRVAGEPLAYIVGYKNFYGLRLKVNPRVLVPRPDTETLVTWALAVLLASDFEEHPRVLDLGTGSGAIALAVAHGLQVVERAAQVAAVDSSSDALAVATENALALGLTVQFLQSNWLDEVSGRLHLIASNPPYIANADPHLSALNHEPLEALTAGSDGLDDIRQIIENAPAHLESGGWLLLEHGYDQAARVRDLLITRGFGQVQSRLDLAGIERCSGGQWHG